MDALIPTFFAVALTVAAFTVALVITRSKPRHAQPPDADPIATPEADPEPSRPKIPPSMIFSRLRSRIAASLRSYTAKAGSLSEPKPKVQSATDQTPIQTPVAARPKSEKPSAKPRSQSSKKLAPETAPYRSVEITRGVSNFTGRSAEIAEIETKLNTSGMLVLQGLPGMGKSSLAHEYAQLKAEKYGAICWLDAEREGGIVEALLQLGAHYMPGLKKAADRYAAAQQVLTTLFPGFASEEAKPALLIFDNIEDQGLAERWRPREGAHVLITSRLTEWKEGAPLISLRTWPLEDAVTYLQRESNRSDLIGPKTAVARQIAERLSCLPLALAHAAAFLKRATTMSADLYLELLDKHIANISGRSDYDRSVFATFQETIFQAEQEAPGAAAMLCFASCFAPDAIPKEIFDQSFELYPDGRLLLPGTATVTSDLRSTVADLAMQTFAFRTLYRYSLITYTEQTKSFDMHRLVQSVGRDLLRGQLQPWIESAIKILDATFPPVRFGNWPACERLVWHVCGAFEALQKRALPASAARLADRCGCYLRERAAYREAESLFRRALSIDESLNGPLHPSVAIHLNNLAGILFDTNRYDEAEPLYRRALEINETRYGPDHPQVAGTLNRLAGGLSATNRLSEAEELYRRALTIEEAYSGRKHPRVAIYLNDFGWVLYETNRLTEAEENYRRALTTFEASYGPKHPNVARTLSNLAVLLAGTNRLSEGEALLRRALEIDEASYGAEHPNVARDLGNLALLLSNANQLAEAERLFRRSLEIDETTYGREHPNVARALNNLARVLFETQRFEETEPLYRRALGIFEASYGAEHPAFAAELNNLASLFRATRRFEEAESFSRRALTINEASYGPKHPNVAKALHTLAGILSAMHRDDEAEALHRRAYEILKASSGPENSELATDIENLQWLLANTEGTEATGATGAGSEGGGTATATSLESLTGLLLFSSNRHSETESLYRRSFAVDESLGGESVRDT